MNRFGTQKTYIQQKMYTRLMKPVIHYNLNFDILNKIKQTEPRVLEEITNLYKRGIDGVIAGGYAAYLLNLTTTYKDVDYFIENVEEFMKYANKKKVNESYCYSVGYSEKYIKANNGECKKYIKFVVSDHALTKLQIIYRSLKNKDYTKYSYYYEVLRRFDVPVCKKGIFLLPIDKNEFKDPVYDEKKIHYIFLGDTKMKNIFLKEFEILNSSYINYTLKKLEERKKKYQNRTIKDIVPTLQELCQDVILYEDCNINNK